MSIDEELRAIFADRAEAAPSRVDLPRVYARSRQLTVRARYRAVAFSTVAVLAVLAPIGLLTTARTTPPAGPTAGPTTASPTPTATPDPGGVPVTLVARQLKIPSFPLAVGWKPAGVTFTVGVHGRQYDLSDDKHGIQVAVSSDQYDWDWEPAQTTTTTINGRPGSLRTGTGDNNEITTGVTWQLVDGRWVTVDSYGATPTDQVLRLARGLHAGQTAAGPLAVTPHLVPDGFVLGDSSATGVCLSPAAWQPATGGAAQGLCVFLRQSDPTVAEYGTPTTIGGRAGYLNEDPAHQLEFRTVLPDGRTLVVGTFGPIPADLPGDRPIGVPYVAISPADLDRFVAAITVP